MTSQEKLELKPNPKNPRLSVRGHELLDPRPKVVFMSIDPDTGEILSEGRPRPPSLADTLARSTGRFDDQPGYVYDADDGEFDEPENDGSYPDHTPFTEGFYESMSISEQKAVKLLKKAGKLPQNFGEPAAPAKTEKQARAPKAGEPSTPPADAAE